jgi:opacity protein-like surface antigen
MRRLALTFLVTGLIAGASRDAAAQTRAWDDRVYLNVGFGVESGTSALTDTRTFLIYDETGTVTSSSTWTSGSLFDGGIGFRVWKNLSVGVSYHQEQNTADIDLTASVPHPVFFNQPRSFTAKVGGDQFRKEKATHLQFGWMLPFGDKLDVLVFGGPSWFRLEQPAVDEFESRIADRSSPFAQVTVAPTVVIRKKSPVGFNVGADASYMVWQNDSVRVGAGFFVRYALAKTNVLILSTEQKTEVGGVQIGFGGRLRF